MKDAETLSRLLTSVADTHAAWFVDEEVAELAALDVEIAFTRARRDACVGWLYRSILTDNLEQLQERRSALNLAQLRKRRGER